MITAQQFVENDASPQELLTFELDVVARLSEMRDDSDQLEFNPNTLDDIAFKVKADSDFAVSAFDGLRGTKDVEIELRAVSMALHRAAARYRVRV